MKRILVLFLSIVVLVILPTLAEEQKKTCTSGDYEYVVLEDGTIEIKRYVGKEKRLEIPALLDGIAVSSIGVNAFAFCRDISQIVIPDSVTSIGDFAFSHCDLSVTIPDSVVDMGKNPFMCCGSHTDIYVSPDNPAFATIEGVLFGKADKRLICYPCDLAATEYSIPGGIEIIGDSAFFSCSSLSSLTIPDSVTMIDNSAFHNCNNLISITIPDSVKLIGDYAFSSCLRLTSIAIPDSVIDVGSNPFRSCGALTDIIISPDHPTLATIDGVLFSKIDKRLVCYPNAFKAKDYPIPSGIQIIGDYAFSDCNNLTSIEIPDSVELIGNSAFHSCRHLTTMTIPDSVASIGDYAFFFCRNLLSVTILGGVTSIGDSAFSHCDSLSSVVIPDSVGIIGNDAFLDCDSITVTVSRDSYAKSYCVENGVKYTYPDANDWLNS